MLGHGGPWSAMVGHGRPWPAMAGLGQPLPRALPFPPPPSLPLPREIWPDPAHSTPFTEPLNPSIRWGRDTARLERQDAPMLGQSAFSFCEL